jgi:hypothetical protein
VGFHRSRAILALAAVTLLCACSAKKAGTAARPATNAVTTLEAADGAKPAERKAVPPALPAAPAELIGQLEKADQTLRILVGRDLDAAQREQRDTGAAFLDQAKSASSAGDSARAAVLVNKSLLLLEDLESRTR